jgi:hypothetical protein
MNIRKAASTDSPALSRLSRDVQSLHAEHHPTVFRMPESDDFAISFFEEKLADPAVTIFIAEENGEALGCILCKLIERPENAFTFASRTLLVDQISVRPEVEPTTSAMSKQCSNQLSYPPEGLTL